MKTELEIKIEKHLELLMTDDYDSNGLTCQEKIEIATTDLFNLFSVYTNEVSRGRATKYACDRNPEKPLFLLYHQDWYEDYDKWLDENPDTVWPWQHGRNTLTGDLTDPESLNRIQVKGGNTIMGDLVDVEGLKYISVLSNIKCPKCGVSGYVQLLIPSVKKCWSCNTTFEFEEFEEQEEQ